MATCSSSVSTDGGTESDLSRLLKSWSLSHKVCQAFEREEVTLRNLKLLSKQTIAELIPAAGPRATFEHHLASFEHPVAATDLLTTERTDDALPARVFLKAGARFCTEMAAGYLALDIMYLQHRVDALERRIEMRARREECNPLDLPNDIFLDKYRISVDLASELCEDLEPFLVKQRASGLSVESQVMAALRFYATGSYQEPTGDSFYNPVSQPSVSRCVRSVSNLLYERYLRQKVRFPMTEDERLIAKQKFSTAAQPFEDTIGAMDCTLIKILAPTEHEEAYVAHGEGHCLNVQAICDPDRKILNINARFPGARHDYYIWQNCAVRTAMERWYNNGERNTYLIGDDGYYLEPWLLTPLKHEVRGTARFLYNERLCQARSVVERLFGTWKHTFRCLSEQRKLMYDPVMAGKIIYACAVLWNMRIEHRLEDPDPVVIEEYRAGRQRIAPDLAEAEREPEVGRQRRRAEAERIQHGYIERVFGRELRRAAAAAAPRRAPRAVQRVGGRVVRNQQPRVL